MALARLLSLRLSLLYPSESYDRILPVPLHPQRLREREFNQSAVLARPLSKALSVPMDLSSVKRVRSTQPQSLLGEKDRRKNVRAAFRVVQPRSIEGKRILIVDDVCTTGATVEELGTAVRDAGASKVDVVTVAQALTINDS